MESWFGYVTLSCSCSTKVARWLYLLAILHLLAFVNNHWGTTFPKALTNNRMVNISPCSEDTCWKVLIFFIPRTLISFGTFWIPVSSPDQIWAGETLVCIFFKRLNHWIITVGFAPIKCAINRFLVFFNVIVGCLAKNPFNHFWLPACVSSLKPLRLFTLACWKASLQTLFMVRGNPLSWNCWIILAKLASSSGIEIREHACKSKEERMIRKTLVKEMRQETD